VSVPTEGEPITASSVLPADREPLRLQTADGVTLAGEVARPTGEVRGTVIALHPLPTHGGSMDSHLLRKMADRLPALAGIAVVRVNTRGTTSPSGASSGAFDHARGEGWDCAAACDWVAGQDDLPDPWVVGWSFGSDVALRHADRPPVVGVILLSPTLRFSDPDVLAGWADSPRPLIAVVAEHDDFLPPEQARQRFAGSGARVVVIAGAGHLWVGEPAVREALDVVAGEVVPGTAPLPRTWRGTMGRWRSPLSAKTPRTPDTLSP